MLGDEFTYPAPHNLSTISSAIITANPKPRYFVTRPDRTISPLIALDELPDNVNISGIPKAITSAETAFMFSLGVAERSGTYVVNCYFNESSSESESQESSPTMSENVNERENVETSEAAPAKETTESEMNGAAMPKTMPLSHESAERQGGTYSGNIGKEVTEPINIPLPTEKSRSLDDVMPDAADAMPLKENTTVISTMGSSNATGIAPVTTHSPDINVELSHLPTDNIVRSEDAVLRADNFKGAQYEADSSSAECVERLDGRCAEVNSTIEAEELTQAAEDEEAGKVEKWRQKVNPVDEKPIEETQVISDHSELFGVSSNLVQAVIDALVAASSHPSEETKEPEQNEKEVDGATSKDVSLVPGQKVYCTHWIRKGECDFLQQGCRYKHEMPDMKTLRAIGVNTPPAWYMATHKEEARKRGFPPVNANAASAQTNWRGESKSFPGPSHTTFRPYQRPQPPAFIQPQSIEFPSNQTIGPFYPSARFIQDVHQPMYPSSNQRHNAYLRVQELSDQQYHQWQNAHPLRGNELKYRPKPRTPGFKTFPFQLPAPEPSHVQRIPMWPTRPSKVRPISMALDHESATKQRSSSSSPKGSKQIASSTLGQTTDEPHNPGPEKATGQATQSEIEQTAVVNSPSPSNAALNVSYAPLEPSPRPDPKLVLAAARERKASVSSDLFALAPKTCEPMPIRRFVPLGEVSRTSTSDKPAAALQNPKSNGLRENNNSSPVLVDSVRTGHRKGRRVPGSSREHEHRKEYQRSFGPGFEYPKRGRKRTAGSSSEKNGKENRTPNGQSEGTELLLDLGS